MANDTSLSTPRLFTSADARALLRPRPADGHKGTFGTALLVCGSRTMGGCAVLAARACLRSGAGKAVLHVPESLRAVVMAAVPEAVVSLDADPMGDVFTAMPAGRFDAIAVGPGLGQSPATARALLDGMAAHGTTPHVIDADALNLLAATPHWTDRLPARAVLTPHPGELARLAGRTIPEAERLETAREMAIRTGAVVVAKGHPTHIAMPNGTTYTNTTGSDAIATAGSGDVLTGITAGLLAQGYAPEAAAPLAVYLHGLAGDLAAQSLGHHSVIASDIADYLPQAFLKTFS
ncbi:MAG: NAD(P)H-hydrate dehydratase [Bacteroidaceae bacterium]|nr:NAD(P)H-hydrate dehydratase [Bacteroidaceae bacterium]